VSEAVREKKPFFLYFQQYAVHAPFQSDPRFAANYKSSGKSVQAQAFATLIEGMDKSLGDVLYHMESLEVADNTLVIFLGDNGSDAPLGHQHEVASSAPLRGKKGSHYEFGMRVPFIASWAKVQSDRPIQKSWPIAAGAIQPQQASVCDLFPTILQLVGVEQAAGHKVDGQSLRRIFASGPDPWAE
jgi:arylsulfatase A-like enzyme